MRLTLKQLKRIIKEEIMNVPQPKTRVWDEYEYMVDRLAGAFLAGERDGEQCQDGFDQGINIRDLKRLVKNDCSRVVNKVASTKGITDVEAFHEFVVTNVEGALDDASD